MGSTYSLVNSAAAAVAGVGPGNTGWQPNHAQVLGVDGRPMSLALGPFASVRLLGPPGDPNGGSSAQCLCMWGICLAFRMLDLPRVLPASLGWTFLGGGDAC
eukprot:CAMPEP_0194706644 /NCGR_PEP_ID=MMETSP0295-20121207/29683_1 /TAXON_ID=39354 /ORGANISM="Heterosigma akashiwo, Strain CCMP2393" /LENGTH=101 /DNA_ID=CAMNT_0039602623 /DNA_START=21 /DNA_END=326 /DNA_ORIENTATION=-